MDDLCSKALWAATEVGAMEETVISLICYAANNISEVFDKGASPAAVKKAILKRKVPMPVRAH